MTRRDDASERQVQAAEPRVSTWLSANAGSGKTRVLTDRVARLLLDGVSPEHILCLTYTKAAASEMQNRLFLRLGEWAMRADAELRPALLELGVPGPIRAEDLRRARTLFARAIETPGGLKIQTIHYVMTGVAAAAIFAFAPAGTAQAADSEACKTVRFSDVGWTDITATTATATVVLKALGYEPVTQVLSVPVTYSSLKNGDIDVFLGNWMPTMEADIKPLS